jgi:hypothetical protein
MEAQLVQAGLSSLPENKEIMQDIHNVQWYSLA